MTYIEILIIAVAIIMLIFILGNLNYHRLKRKYNKNLFSTNDNLNIIIDYIFSLEQVSSRELETKFSVSYARAQRILDILEQMGLIKSRKYPNLHHEVNKTQINLLFDGYLLINKNVWAFILTEVRKKDPALYKSLENTSPNKIDGGTLSLRCQSKDMNTTQIDYSCLENVIDGLIGKRIHVKCDR